MEIKLKLHDFATDDERVTDPIFDDFVSNGIELELHSVTQRLEEDTTILYSLWIGYGKDQQKTLMFDADLYELEMFATCILKNIEQVKFNYSKQLQAIKAKELEC